MGDYVWLHWLRTRGWPWPDDSWGNTPMYGETGWCHSCGVPQLPQGGSLVLQRRSLTCTGVWLPNWQFDAICLDAEVATAVRARFGVELRPVAWPRTPLGEAYQIVAPTVGSSWFDPEMLRERTIARHGRDGARCPVCGTWRWLPLTPAMLPPLDFEPALGDVDVAASPEWFGDGCSARRQILVSRGLAELLASSSPRDLAIQELDGRVHSASDPVSAPV